MNGQFGANVNLHMKKWLPKVFTIPIGRLLIFGVLNTHVKSFYVFHKLCYERSNVYVSVEAHKRLFETFSSFCHDMDHQVLCELAESMPVYDVIMM